MPCRPAEYVSQLQQHDCESGLRAAERWRRATSASPYQSAKDPSTCHSEGWRVMGQGGFSYARNRLNSHAEVGHRRRRTTSMTPSIQTVSACSRWEVTRLCLQPGDRRVEIGKRGLRWQRKGPRTGVDIGHGNGTHAGRDGRGNTVGCIFENDALRRGTPSRDLASARLSGAGLPRATFSPVTSTAKAPASRVSTTTALTEWRIPEMARALGRPRSLTNAISSVCSWHQLRSAMG